MEIFLAVCGSGIFAAIAAIVAPIILEKLRRKHKKEDDRDTVSGQINILRNDIKNYNERNAKRFEKIESGLCDVAKQTDALVENEIARTHASIRRKALRAIKENKISVKDKEALLMEYERYKRLPNSNGYLKQIMQTITTLQVIVDDDDMRGNE